MRLGGLAQRQHLINTGRDLAGSKTVGEKSQRVADQFGPVVVHRKVEANQGLRFRHQAARREWLSGTASGTEQQMPAKGGERVEVLLENLTTDRLDQHVHTTPRRQLADLVGPSGLVVG